MIKANLFPYSKETKKSLMKRLFLFQPVFMFSFCFIFQGLAALDATSTYMHYYKYCLLFLILFYLLLLLLAFKKPFCYLVSYLFSGCVVTLGPISAAITMWYYTLSRHTTLVLTISFTALYLFCFIGWYRLIDYQKVKQKYYNEKILDKKNGYYDASKRGLYSIDVIYRPAKHEKLKNALLTPLAMLVYVLASGGSGLLLVLGRIGSENFRNCLIGGVSYTMGLLMIYFLHSIYMEIKILRECEKKLGKKFIFI